MADCVNWTSSDGWNFYCMPFNLQLLLGVISTMLVLSLSWNILCCMSRFFSEKGTCRPKLGRRRSPRQMEENPIYGNISYMQTSTTVYTEVDPHNSPSGSSSLRDPQEVNRNPQSKTQDCYANLTLKPPRVQTGRTSPQIQYSDVVHIEEPSVVSEKEDEGNTDAVSTMSDLYASVQTQRTKTVDTADNGEDYANHL
ncbi:Signaling threshold-regulating transmembrane adapter 1 [Channa argus]|uniref:Signaling threshold-regulating transmembrane adapter 1 n=1 Tax=Channa argus TaxID=215402 RepID=A0A6G1PI79_CHAAH|nr:Signaling threshold-regulating transmembrane adapter 1 [Channa argus]